MARYCRRGRALRLLAVLLTLGSLASCAMRSELAAPPAAGSSTEAPDWHATEIARGTHRIVGYRTVDGAYQRFESTVRLVGDSLEFEAVPGSREATRVVRPASEVAAVDLFATPAAGMFIAIALAGVLAMIVYYYSQ